MDHNRHYQPLILRELPTPVYRVLDVGCGAGGFAALLAQRAEQVDAVDRSPAMIAQARARVPANVTCVEADILEMPLPAGTYDAITSISALHHLRLDDVLPRLAASLRPGGTLVATALPKTDLPRELRQAESLLPGVRVRRLLLWRYLMVWRKPSAGT